MPFDINVRSLVPQRQTNRAARLQNLLSIDLAFRKQRIAEEAARAKADQSAALNEAKLKKIGLDIQDVQMGITQKQFDLKKKQDLEDKLARDKAYTLFAQQELSQLDLAFHDSNKTEEDIANYGASIYQLQNKYAGIEPVQKFLGEKLKSYQELSKSHIKAKHAALAIMGAKENGDMRDVLFNAQLGGILDDVLKMTGVGDPDHAVKAEKLKLEREKLDLEKKKLGLEIEALPGKQKLEEETKEANLQLLQKKIKDSSADKVQQRQVEKEKRGLLEKIRAKNVKTEENRKAALNVFLNAKREKEQNDELLAQEGIDPTKTVFNERTLQQISLGGRRALSNYSRVQKTFSDAQQDLWKYPGLKEEAELVESSGVTLSPLQLKEAETLPQQKPGQQPKSYGVSGSWEDNAPAEVTPQLGNARQSLLDKFGQLDAKSQQEYYQDYLDNPDLQGTLERINVKKSDLDKLLKGL